MDRDYDGLGSGWLFDGFSLTRFLGWLVGGFLNMLWKTGFSVGAIDQFRTFIRTFIRTFNRTFIRTIH